jgi:hypothetical protein
VWIRRWYFAQTEPVFALPPSGEGDPRLVCAYFIASDGRGVVQLSHIGRFEGMDTAKVRSILSFADGNVKR